MYIINHMYRNFDNKEVFETYEEALKEAQSRASFNMDDESTFVVNEVKAVVNPDKQPQPITTIEVNDETREALISKKHGDAKKIPVADYI